MENALAKAMIASGYEGLNKFNCRIVLDDKIFRSVLNEFSDYFPRLIDRKVRT